MPLDRIGFQRPSPRPRPARAALRDMMIAGVLPFLLPAAGAAAGDWPPHPSVVRYPEEIPIPQDHPTQVSLKLAHPGVRDFLTQHRGWSATIDPLTGSVDRAFGEGLPLDLTSAGVAARKPGRGSSEEARLLGSSFLSSHGGLLAAGIELEASWGTSLSLNEQASRPLGDSRIRFVRYDLHKDGLPVLGAGLSIGVREGKAVLVVSRALGRVTTSSEPKLDALEALDAVASDLERAGHPAPSLISRKEASLAHYPRVEGSGPAARLRHHLVWVIQVKPEEAPFYEWHIAYVDAQDGRVLALFPEAQTAGSCSADPKQARAAVRGGVRPIRADDPEVVRNLPLVNVNAGGVLLTADRNGRFPVTAGQVSSLLEGQSFRSHCDQCLSPVEPVAAAGESGDISFGTGGTSNGAPITGNGTSSPADRTAYFHTNQTRMLLDKWDNAFFDEVDIFVNINATCNAFSGSYMLGFFVGGAGCRNTGEIAGVVHHELGHTWDRFDGNGITSGSMSEYKSDTLAMFMGGTSCVGDSFFTSGGPTSACSGVRDIDEKAPGRTGLPLTPSECPTCATLTRTTSTMICGGVHCRGQIPGQATWHLLNNLMLGTDYVNGAALPAGNPAFSPEQARWLVERLFVAGGAPMETFDPTLAGVSVYDAIMLMDDEDANLANGTPHAAYINNAFSHHQIAESPLVVDAANCAPLSDPVPAVTLEQDPATGLPLARIAWTPVGGATAFDVYRNSRVGEGFLPLAQDVSAGPVIDTGVQAGATYRYFVAAVRKTGCAAISPGGNVVTVTVDMPDLSVASRALSEAPGGSDGDGRLEPGERVRVALTLGETAGMSGATGVTAAISSTSPASPVTIPGPISFGAIPAGGSAAGASDFEVFVGPTETCGGRVHVVVSASGNEGCWQSGFDIPIDATGSCAATASAFVEPVPGTLQLVTSSGDGDAILDNCETSTLSYQIRNNGSVASGPASSTVSSSHPGVTFAPTPLCTVGNLNPAASAICQFSMSLGGASPSGIPFALVADSAGNAAPSRRDVVLGAETDTPVFSDLSFGFEGSLQGWTGQQFSLSSDPNRVSSGTHSAHSGLPATPPNNLCGKLTSPAFLLNPGGTSTLSFQMYALIEPFTDAWYDRANVHIIDVATGQHTLVSPSSGLAYNAFGNEQGGECHNAGQNGWAGLLGGFNLETFNLAAFAGRRIRIEINYDTDEGDDREGLFIDDVVLTNATLASFPPDQQGNTCVVPEVSPPLAPIPHHLVRQPGDIYRFTWQDLGPGFQYNLYSGSLGSYYSHGPGPLVCSGLGSGVACAGGSCQHDRPGSGLPAGSLYFLVTASGFGEEGTSGFASGGAERDPARSTCAP